MGQLEVFDTRGNRIYPTNDVTDSNIASYFERFVFGMTTEAAEPHLEAYARMVLGEGGREQVFIRYTGERASTLVSDCRKAVQRQLLDERGWRLVEHDGPSDPRALFYTLVKGNGAPTGGQNSITDWFRSIVRKPEYANVATDWLESDDTTPLKVYARDYETIARAIPRFLDSSVHVFVGRSSSRERSTFQSTSDDGIDIELLPDSRRTNRSEFSLHPDTEDQLEMRWEERREEVREEKYATIRSAIGELSELNASPDEVRQNVEQALQREYSRLQVTRQQRQSGLGDSLDPGGGPGDGGQSPEKLATADDSSRLPGWVNRKKAVALSIVSLVVLALLVGATLAGFFPGLPGGGSGDGFTMNGNTLIISGAAGNQPVGNQPAGAYNVSISEKGSNETVDERQLQFPNATNVTTITVSVREKSDNRTIRERNVSVSNGTTRTVFQISPGEYVVNVTVDGVTKSMEVRVNRSETATATTTNATTPTRTNTTTT